MFSAEGWLPPPLRYLPQWNSVKVPIPDPNNFSLPPRGWGSDPFRHSPRATLIHPPYAPPVHGFPPMTGFGDEGALDRIQGFYYDPSNFSPRRWANASSAVVHMQHGFFWGSWQFQLAVDGRDHEKHALRFWYGGYQASGWATGGPWFVENVLEELSTENEWFFDPAQQLLYFLPNRTAEHQQPVGGSTTGLEAVTLATLIRVQGSHDRPVRHLLFRGIEFAQTATTLLQPYVMPSGGDYRVYPGGAVEVNGAENVSFVSNTFADLGGNGLFLSGYVAQSTVSQNEFVRLGDSAVYSVGSLSNTSHQDGSFPTTPSQNLFTHNHVHRIGMYVNFQLRSLVPVLRSFRAACMPNRCLMVLAQVWKAVGGIFPVALLWQRLPRERSLRWTASWLLSE